MLRVFQAHAPTTSTRTVKFSPDGRMLVTTGFNDELIRIWDTTQLSRTEQVKKLAQLEQSGHVTDLAISHDGERLASACSDGNVRLWDLGKVAAGGDLRPVVIPSLFDSCSEAVAFAYDGRVVVGGSGYLIRICAVGGTRSLPGHEARVSAVATNGRLIASASIDGEVKLWDVDEEPSAALEDHVSSVQAAIVAAGGRLVVSGSYSDARSGEIRFSEAECEAGRERRIVSRIEVARQSIYGLAADSDGTLVAAVSFNADDNTSRLLLFATSGTRQPRPVGSWVIPETRGSEPVAFAMSRDGGRVSIGTSGGRVFVWTISPEGLRRDLMLTHFASCSSLEFLDREGRWVAVGSRPKLAGSRARQPAVRVVDVGEGATVATHFVDPEIGGALDLAYRPSDGLLAVGFEAGAVQMLRFLPDGTLSAANPLIRLTRSVTSIAIHPHEPRLFCGQADGFIGIYDIPSGRELLKVRAHIGTKISALSFDPTGEFLVTASFGMHGRDNSVKLIYATRSRR